MLTVILILLWHFHFLGFNYFVSAAFLYLPGLVSPFSSFFSVAAEDKLRQLVIFDKFQTISISTVFICLSLNPVALHKP